MVNIVTSLTICDIYMICHYICSLMLPNEMLKKVNIYL